MPLLPRLLTFSSLEDKTYRLYRLGIDDAVVSAGRRPAAARGGKLSQVRIERVFQSCPQIVSIGTGVIEIVAAGALVFGVFGKLLHVKNGRASLGSAGKLGAPGFGRIVAGDVAENIAVLRAGIFAVGLIVEFKRLLGRFKVDFAAGVAAFQLGILPGNGAGADKDGDYGDDNEKFNQSEAMLHFEVNGEW